MPNPPRPLPPPPPAGFNNQAPMQRNANVFSFQQPGAQALRAPMGPPRPMVPFAAQQARTMQLANQSMPRPGFGPQMPPPPPPVGFNRQPVGFGPRPANSFANPQQNFNNYGYNQEYAQQVDGPYINNYDILEDEINYGDNQYIKDLKELEQFYEENKYSPILEKRYKQYDIGWTPPKITLPEGEIYDRLKYYDDILTYENLDQNQIIEAQNNIKSLVDQITNYDDYSYYKKFGHERLFYNDNFSQDYEDNSFRNINYYQREDDLSAWGGSGDAVPIPLPKAKWWMTQDYIFPEQESSFVRIISSNNYPNELLTHPMFSYLNEYGSFEDLNSDKILEQYPQSTVNNTTINQNVDYFKSPIENEKTLEKQKKHWWSKKDKKKGKNMKADQIERKEFPKKENPPPPQPTIMPPKHNPPPPQPTIMPPKRNPNLPPQPGKGFGPSNNGPQQYFNYQQR